MASFLVVANQTSGGEALGAHLRRVIAADPDARFVVLVPMSTPAPVDLGGAMGVMSGIAVIDPEVQDQIRDVARDRLARILAWLRDAGVEADGTVVGDPLAAMEAAMDAESFDEIIVSTLPARLSQWMRRDLVRRATRRFDVPVTTVMAADTGPDPAGPEPDGGAAPTQDATAAATATTPTRAPGRRVGMADSVYKIIELVGTSSESWEQAATAAIATASRSLRDLRVAEVSELDMVIDDGAVVAYRAKVKVSFKYDGEG
jgi:flavin-binding protein dodecin